MVPDRGLFTLLYRSGHIRASRLLAAGSALLIVALSSVSLALSPDESSRLYELINGQKYDAADREAADLADQFPDDPEPVFARALIAERSGEDDRAIALYRELTLSHPRLLEPFNNLAIHQARDGDYAAAIQTLERAMKANPAVATAYANLTAIYAQLASAAYRKALNSSTPLAPLNLATLDKIQPQSVKRAEVPSLVTSVENFVNESISSSRSTESVVEVEPAEAVVVAAAEPEPAEPTEPPENAQSDSSQNARPALQPIEQPAETTQPVIAATPEPEPEPEPQPEPVAEPTVAPEPEPAPAPAVEVAVAKPDNAARQAAELIASDKQALINHIKSWAVAWSDRDVDRYLGHYSNSFVPRNGLSLGEWKKQRYGRLRWREFIIVKPSNYNIDLDGNEATVNFTQYYKSERFEDTIRKTLKFRKSGKQWLIVQELI